jgi:hypothetical protein
MKLFRRSLLGLVFATQFAVAGPILPHLVIQFDSLLEGPPIPTISGNDSFGAPVVFAPTPPTALCVQLVQAILAPLLGPNSQTQCLFSNPVKFPDLVFDGGVNLIEPDDGGISDTVEVHVRSFQTALGSVFAAIIVYTTDLEGSLAAIPGAANIVETGDWQDITDAFFDFNTGIRGLPEFLLPPTPNDPHTFAPLQILVRSDVPEPSNLALAFAGLIGLVLARRRTKR